MNSFFNWYYVTSTVGIVLSLTFIVYILNSISWVIGFALPTGFMLVAVIAFFGTNLDVFVEPEGSVFSSIARIFVAQFRNRRLELPCPDDAQQQESMLYNPMNCSDRIMKLPFTLQFRFLNKAAIISNGQLCSDANPWRLCSIQQIEEVKCLLRIVPIWAFDITCFDALAQQWTFAILKALTMNHHLGPHFEFLMGVAEAFNAIGQIEFCNRQFPEHMQTLANSLFFCSIASANYMSTFLVSVVQKVTAAHGRTSWLDNNINIGRVDNFYYLIAILGVFNLVYFLLVSHFYRYKGAADAKGDMKDEDII